MWESFLDLFFPRHSLAGAEGEWITPEESAALTVDPVIEDEAELRAHGIQHIDRIVAACDYDKAPLLRKAVHALKYRRVRGVAGVLGAMLVEAVQDVEWHQRQQGQQGFQGDGHHALLPLVTLVPVPLHWTRTFQRGFNQSELLARAVAVEMGWDVRSLLRRVRSTGSQVGRERAERLEGVKDAFVCSATSVPSFVVLVDDLSTTGATLDACACALKKAGVKRVEGLVLARG